NWSFFHGVVLVNWDFSSPLKTRGVRSECSYSSAVQQSVGRWSSAVFPLTNLHQSLWSRKETHGRNGGMVNRKRPKLPTYRFEESSYDEAVAGTGKLRKRKPKMIPKIP